VRVSLSADAFLHHMVRNLVGALVAVGAGREKASWMRELLEARDRARGPATFAADGLYFTGADYDSAFGLPPTRRDVVMEAGVRSSE
jgi:tRNA pseudouridine38-40 synthase